MATEPRHTAKIYAFPAGGRAQTGQRPWLSGPDKAPAPPILPGSGGYHEAAIQEERTRKP